MGNKGKLLFTLIAVLAIAAIGAGAMSLTGSTSNNSPATTVDISGNCDEAEHANDLECAVLGGTAPAPSPTASPEDRASDDPNDDVREPGEDISGPCDEAEHANDPRCTGTQVDDPDDDDRDDDDRDDDDRDDDDNSGPGSDDSDRSGSNSGRG